MPVISLDLVGQNNGAIFYPTAQEVTNLQNTITINILEVLSANFPDQLGYVNHVDPLTGLNQYDIAKQAVHDAFPGYIVVAANQSAYPTTIYSQSTDNGITVLADIRIVELALDETIQDKMVIDLTNSIQSSLGLEYPNLDINVNTTMITGNVEISLPGVAIDGVISAESRSSSDVSFHEVLFSQILAATDVAGVNGTPLDLFLVDQLHNIDGLRGGAGRDILVDGFGDNLLDGGAGLDVAAFDGTVNDYTIGLQETAANVVDLVLKNVHTGDTTILRNIELGWFGGEIYKTKADVPTLAGIDEAKPLSDYVQLMGVADLQAIGAPAAWLAYI